MFSFIFLMFVSTAGFSQVDKNKVEAQINFQNDTVHVEMLGRDDWKYELDRTNQRVELEVDSLSEKSILSLQKFKNKMVKSVEIKKDKTVGRDLVLFNLTGESIEHFDYLTDEPSRLIIDFYVNPEVKKSEVKEKKASSAKKTSSKVSEDKKADRKIASETVVVDPKGPLAFNTSTSNFGLFDSADPNFDRFTIKDYEIKEESIIKSRDRFYIHFPWLQRHPQQWDQVVQSGSVYHVHPRTDDENKQMRLLLRLFEKKRNKVFLQTAEWFNEKYPKSEYNEIIDFMKADVKWQIYEGSQEGRHFDTAMQTYREALQKNPLSSMAEKTSLLLGIRYYEKNDFVNSLRAFHQHIENPNFSDSKVLSKDLARLGVGLSYIQLKKYKEAEETLRGVEKNSENESVKHEAAYHLGDIFVLSKNYSKAIEEYNVAQRKYPQVQNKFPNSYFNKGEAEFWLGNYRKALEDYRQYVMKFPSDDHAPLALTRLGETLEILGADKSRVMGAYLEAYFRYGDSLNAVIARIRMTAARMKGMKPKEVEIATQDILSLSKRVRFDDADKLATILISEGYSERGEYDKTIDLLVKYYQQHPTMAQLDYFTKRIIANINAKMKELVNQGDFIQAFKVHQNFSEVWLKKSDRLDTRFYLGKSFEMAGVPKEAEKFYREVLNRLLSIEGTSKEKEIRVVQEVPSKESLYLRLAGVQGSQKKLQEAYEALKQIRSLDSLNQDEQIERVMLTAELLSERDQLDSARRFVMELLKTWRGEPHKLEEPYFKLAEIETKTGQYGEALRSLRKIDEIYQDTKLSHDDIHFKSFEKRLQIAETTKNDKEAIEAATRMLEVYEDTRPVASIRYKLGKTYFKQGEIKKAEEAWTSFKGAQSDFWKKLAQEQVKNLNWRDDYKKYINRIPAMSRQEESE